MATSPPSDSSFANNGAKWTSQADNWVRQARRDYGEQVEVLHYNHDAIVRSLQRGPHIDTVLTLSGGIVAEDLNFKRVLVGRIPVRELHRIFEEHGDRLLERNVRRFLDTPTGSTWISVTLFWTPRNPPTSTSTTTESPSSAIVSTSTLCRDPTTRYESPICKWSTGDRPARRFIRH